MIDRRMFTTLLAGGAAGSLLVPGRSWAQAAAGHTVFYAAVGPDLTCYSLDIEGAALTRRGTVTLPANVQYAWPHPSKPFLYVASSNRGPGVTDEKSYANAFRIDPMKGSLTFHGAPQTLPSRPVHTSVDMAGEYLLVAFNEPSSLAVYRINADGSVGDRVEQPNPLDTGIYAHQIRATPDNKNVILVTRGHNAPGDNPVNPGSLKVFGFNAGILTGLAAIAPGDGTHFGPRHLDFHPTGPWVYVSLESQHKLYVYKRDPVTGLSRDPLFTRETLMDPAKAGPRQHAGAIHMHPNGRILYVANRDSGLVDFEGKKVSGGGQNNIAVYTIDPSTGEPNLIQNVDGHAIEMRTFGIDPSGRLLVAASIWSQLVREGDTVSTVSAGLSVFRAGGDGKIEFVRKYDVDVGNRKQWWGGMVTPS